MRRPPPDTRWEGLPPTERLEDLSSGQSKLKKTIDCEGRHSEMYAKWINSRLRAKIDDKQMSPIEDLARDMKTGIALYHLIEALSGRKPSGKLSLADSKHHHISNLNVAFRALSDSGIKTVNVGPLDLYDGNLTCILGLMWTSMCFFATSEVNPKYALAALKRNLLTWASSHVGDLPSRDFREAFRDGRVLAEILQKLDPLRAPEYDDSLTETENLLAVFCHAKAAFDVPVLLDISLENPLDANDEKSLVAYVSEFKHCIELRNNVPKQANDDDEDDDDGAMYDYEVEDVVAPAVFASSVIELSRAPETTKIAVGIHRARALYGGKSINPYCVIKYKDKESKTHHVDSTCDPDWHHTQLIDVEHPLTDTSARIIIFIFSANTLFADTLLGKVELLLFNLLEISSEKQLAASSPCNRRDQRRGDDEESSYCMSPSVAAAASAFGVGGAVTDVPCCVMKRSFLAVTPCDTREQDELRHTRFSGTRSVQRSLNVFHDNRILFKNAGFLGAVEISVHSLGNALIDM